MDFDVGVDVATVLVSVVTKTVDNTQVVFWLQTDNSMGDLFFFFFQLNWNSQQGTTFTPHSHRGP